MIRTLRQSRAGLWLLSGLLATAVRLCWHTTRWTVEGMAHRDGLLARGVPIVTAFWHGRSFFSALLAPPGRQTVAMISNNTDGALIAAVVGRFGVGAVRGSSRDPRKPGRHKGGMEAYAAALSVLGAGGVVAITPDGPRGPRMRAHPGAAALSAAAQAPVLPWVISTRRASFARSWDSYLIPRPFDRGLLIYGAPIEPPPAGDDAAIEAHRLAIEAALNALTHEADTRMGLTPPSPA